MLSLYIVDVNYIAMEHNIISFLSYLQSDSDSLTISNTIREEAKQQLPKIFDNLSKDDFEYFWNVTQLPDTIPLLDYNDSLIKSIISEVLDKAYQILPLSQQITIVILPTFYTFFLEKLDGVMGYAPTMGGTIFLNINTSPTHWEKSLRDTIAHEYHHVAIHEYHAWETIGQILIFEGLAEHFRDEVIGGDQSPWIAKIDSIYEKELLSFIPKFLDNWHINAFTTESIYDSLFFGDNTHPEWLGYSLGYIIIRDIQSVSHFSWEEITQKDPFELWELWLEIKKGQDI